MNYICHETAIIDKGAQIGKDCRIWHWTHVSPGASIGSNVSLGQNVFVCGTEADKTGTKIRAVQDEQFRAAWV